MAGAGLECALAVSLGYSSYSLLEFLRHGAGRDGASIFVRGRGPGAQTGPQHHAQYRPHTCQRSHGLTRPLRLLFQDRVPGRNPRQRVCEGHLPPLFLVSFCLDEHAAEDGKGLLGCASAACTCACTCVPLMHKCMLQSRLVHACKRGTRARDTRANVTRKVGTRKTKNELGCKLKADARTKRMQAQSGCKQGWSQDQPPASSTAWTSLVHSLVPVPALLDQPCLQPGPRTLCAGRGEGRKETSR